MLDVKPVELQQINNIFSKQLLDGSVKPYAFGSRTQGSARQFSDLDIVLISSEPLAFSLLAELQEAFSESDLPYRVDLVDWGRISDAFKAVIEPQLIAF